ncbi:MAG: alpha/beta fold hydrolase [Thermoanaerobaculia bacterium]|nr:alpha/beta fold hydrolase [Thermoanaerobaculia bacterium]
MPTLRPLAAVLPLTFALALPLAAAGEEPKSDSARLDALERQVGALADDLDQARKAVDDLLFFARLGDVAEVDKVAFVGPPNPRGTETFGIANERHPFRVYQYVFVPKNLDKSRKHPLIVLPHGGVHGDFGTYHVHILREMLAEGYVVVAPEYRGSTGYGRGFRQAIDYGGLEVDDVVAGRDWAVEMLPFVDPDRVAIVGWSHGGLIALLATFDHPEKFAAAYAGVPVSDLILRLGYYDDEYRDLYSADYHIGQTPHENVAEYRRRSPVWNVAKLAWPPGASG